MLRYTYYIFFFLLLTACRTEPQESAVQFQVVSPPPYHTENSSIFIAGNFNGWNPADTAFQLNYKGEGLFELKKSFPPAVKGNLEYKYTRGSWETEEANGKGGKIANREVKYAGGLLQIKDTIRAWDLKPPSSSATGNVSVFREAMEIPQLARNRRVWVYLPSDYAQSTKRYPVIYMHDGQNLFDQLVAPFGEWGVDETLNQFEQEHGFSAIVVGIDHGDSLRLREYSPYTNPKYIGGEGDEYLAFLVKTLKPLIDQEFRTLADREHTAIAGASMGGLISFCAATTYPETFSKFFVFSPSFWFNDQVFIDAEKLANTPNMQIYLLVGAAEGAMMVNGTKKMQATLEQTGKFSSKNLKTVIVKGGKHNETFWQSEFPNALSWLFDLHTK